MRLYRSNAWHDDYQCALCKTVLPDPLLPTLNMKWPVLRRSELKEQVIRELIENAEWLRTLDRYEGIPELEIATGTTRCRRHRRCCPSRIAFRGDTLTWISCLR